MKFVNIRKSTELKQNCFGNNFSKDEAQKTKQEQCAVDTN